METRAVFRNLSPLDHRYYQANREAFDELSNHLSEEAAVRYGAMVECALLSELLAERETLTPEYAQILDSLPEQITPDEVYEEEEKTRHNIRALVRVIKRKLPAEIAALVHVGATSVDILDTASALRYREAMRQVVLPRLLKLERLLIQLADDHATTLQVGRTHGQHGVPITFGFAVAEYVSRLGKSIEEIAVRSSQLRGKIAGAVGAYNSLSLITSDPVAFERRTLARLDLLPGDHATQLVEPEFLLRLMLELNVAFGIIANIADDLRNLQRSEIDELREHFTGDQVGSSTMPQKRNPWNSEHVKSLWKTFAPRTMTFFMDQISEHQRDLTNSASIRFVVDYVAGFLAAVERITGVVSTLRVDKEQMEKNVRLTGDLVLAEAAYTLLASTGASDAHEDLRNATIRAEGEGLTLQEVLSGDTELWQSLRSAMERVGLNPDQFFSSPASYTGRSAEQAERLAINFTQRMNAIEEGLQR